MTEAWILTSGGVAFAALVLGRALHSRVIRQLSVMLSLVVVAAAGQVVVRLLDAPLRWVEATDVALLLVLGLLLARAVLLVIFDFLLERRAGHPVPRLARDIAGALVYLVVAAVVLRTTLGLGLTPLLATPALVLAVLGLALQEMLGTLFAGLALSWERRLVAGDWIELDGVMGKIEEIGWRSVVIRTTLGECVLAPNSHVARARVKVLGHGDEAVAFPIRLQAGYGASPHEVKAALGTALVDLPFGDAGREPEILVAELADSGIVYECRVWTLQPGRTAEIRDAVLERARMALTRAGIEIPFPQRTVLFRCAAVDDASQHCRRALAATPLFAGLGDEVLDELAAASRPLEYAPGEAVVRDGDASLALYVVTAGELDVEKSGHLIGRVGAGEVFGEMALLTGQPRAATVRSRGAVHAIEIDAGALRTVLGRHRELADDLAGRVAVRQQEMVSAGEAPVEAETPRGLAAYLRERLLRLLDG